MAFDLARDLAEPLFSQPQDHAGEGARATQSNLATRPHLASKIVVVTWRLLSCVVYLCFVLIAISPAIAEATKRLMLKDGSYQTVTKYEVQGDRVRYRSADREEWEEIPKALIDWKATEDFNAGRTKSVEAAEAVELDKEAEADLKEEEARTPEVAPGLRLPDGGGVVLLDSFKGEPQLVEIPQNGGELNRNMGKNILRGAINPVAGQKQSVELENTVAAIQAHSAKPVFFISPQSDDPTAADANTAVKAEHESSETDAARSPQRFRIVRADVKKEVRVVGVVKVAITGKVSQENKFVETTNEAMSGGWVKVTPVKGLDTGEYAVVEMLGKAGMNLFVWDFGVNPKAAANPSAWRAVGAKTAKPDAPVKLEKKN